MMVIPYEFPGRLKADKRLNDIFLLIFSSLVLDKDHRTCICLAPLGFRLQPLYPPRIEFNIYPPNLIQYCGFCHFFIVPLRNPCWISILKIRFTEKVRFRICRGKPKRRSFNLLLPSTQHPQQTAVNTAFFNSTQRHATHLLSSPIA